MTDLQAQIEEVIRQIVHLDKVEDQLTTTRSELKESLRQLEKIEKKLNYEAEDIEKLEGLSTRGIFHTILGNKESQLEKERQEYLELSLKFEDLRKTIQLLEYEENLLEAKLGSSDELNVTLERLKQAREDEIIQSDPELRDRLNLVSKNLEEQYHLKKQLDEAIEIGEVCFNMINQIASHLQQVKNWGDWKGRNRRRKSRYLKKDAIDRARNLSFQVKHQLTLFDKELRDIGKRLNADLDTSQFTDFNKFFFDNLITDWIMHQKVIGALRSVINTGRQIKSLLQRLKTDLAECDQFIKDLKSKREHILIS